MEMWKEVQLLLCLYLASGKAVEILQLGCADIDGE